MNGPSERAEEPRPEGSSTTAGDGKQSDDMHGMRVPSVPVPHQSPGSSSHTEAAQGYGTSLPPSFSRETRSSTTIHTTSILPNPQSQGQPELFGGSFHMDWQQSPAGPSQSPATMQTPQHVDPLIHNPQAGPSSHSHLWTASTFSGPHPAQEPGIVGNTTLYDQLDFPVGPSTAPNPEDGTADLGFSDCMFIDDTMTMWSNAPASFG